MQQVVSEESAIEQDYVTTGSGPVITFEVLAVAVLLVFSLLIRVAELDTVPIAPLEIPNALAAYQSLSGSEAVTTSADSPLVFWAQRIGFGLFGHSEGTARLLTAILGAVVALLPLAFRDVLGRGRAFVFAVLLTFSPTLFAASRDSSDMIWALLLATGGLWSLHETLRRERDGLEPGGYAVTATALFGVTALLAGPAGPLLVIVLLAALIVAYVLTALDLAAPLDDMSDEDAAGPAAVAPPPQAPFEALVARLAGWPWLTGALATGVAVFVVGTGFLLYPQGLSVVGAGLDGFLRGFVERSLSDVPLFLPLVLSAFYEPLLWVFGVLGFILLLRRDAFDFTERFLLAWAGFGVVVALIYPGVTPDLTLLIVVPLAGLAAYLVEDAFDGNDITLPWSDDWMDADMRLRSTPLAKLGLALLMFVLLVVFTVHLHMVARGFIDVPNGALGTFIGFLDDAAFSRVAASLLWLMIAELFALVGYFLAGSVWGPVLPLRAGVIGGFAFLLMAGTATGWTMAVTRASDPREPWHAEAVSEEAYALRETLIDIALRETAGFPRVPIVAMVEPDGVLAWLLRDFENVTYVDTVAEARNAQVALLPSVLREPDLGSDYVGQDYVLARRWSAAEGLSGFDFLPWWAVRETRTEPSVSRQITVWVRQDVFNSEVFLR